ncbi:hypothetical protein [Streptomyces sp. NBC_00859]|uniref:hypothetical protein n=1 Tax=Streptomyces sp. NBC_00859 TaxID=2903682 RepID=UPI0038677889|nr:hypothetical protein OG584_12195 [Streptomyces sp. NBC_00859]
MVTAAGTHPRGQSDPEPCLKCQELDLAEAVAKAENDPSGETDCRVLRRRHRQAEHGERQP